MALEWGEIDPAIELIRMIAERRGLGAVLAEGSREVGKKFGAEEDAMNVKGLEMPFHEIRGSADWRSPMRSRRGEHATTSLCSTWSRSAHNVPEIGIVIVCGQGVKRRKGRTCIQQRELSRHLQCDADVPIREPASGRNRRYAISLCWLNPRTSRVAQDRRENHHGKTCHEHAFGAHTQRRHSTETCLEAARRRTCGRKGPGSEPTAEGVLRAQRVGSDNRASISGTPQRTRH